MTKLIDLFYLHVAGRVETNFIVVSALMISIIGQK